jgi:hypothetical protein
MFPQSYHRDTLIPEGVGGFDIPLTISLNLRLPKATTLLRDMSACQAAMPEAPIHEHR